MSRGEKGVRGEKDVRGEMDVRAAALAAAAGAAEVAAPATPAASAPRVDRRVRRSRRAIVAAFDRLIMEAPLERITVSAVAREADVDRKTIYQHFGSIDGLLDAIAEDVVTALLDEVEQAMRLRADEGEGELTALHAFFGVLAEYLGENTALRQRYCEHVPPDVLFERLARPLMRQVAERGLVRAQVSKDEMEMELAFGLGGLFSLYRWWLLAGRPMPVEELTRRACQMMEHGVAGKGDGLFLSEKKGQARAAHGASLSQTL